MIFGRSFPIRPRTPRFSGWPTIVTAGCATGTGAAYPAVQAVAGGAAQGTGAANAPSPQIIVIAGCATGTGAALPVTAGELTIVPAGCATGVAAAYLPTFNITQIAGIALGGITAQPPLAEVTPDPGDDLADSTLPYIAHIVMPEPDAATGSGQAFSASHDPYVIGAVGVGTAYQAISNSSETTVFPNPITPLVAVYPPNVFVTVTAGIATGVVAVLPFKVHQVRGGCGVVFADFDTDFLSLMSSAFRHRPTLGHDGFGGVIYDANETTCVPCHVTYRSVIVRGDAEETVSSTAQIECPPPEYVAPGGIVVPQMTVGDRVVLADLVERRVLATSTYVIRAGESHQYVLLT